VHDEIPATLICDDMVAATLKKKQITAVIVGADRVAANGDTANKIGTYQVHARERYGRMITQLWTRLIASPHDGYPN